MNITKARFMNTSLATAHTTVSASRLIGGCITGLIAAALIFAAPEVGIIGAISAVAMGVVSAVLVHPHA
jgi:hypothetical protein